MKNKLLFIIVFCFVNLKFSYALEIDQYYEKFIYNQYKFNSEDEIEKYNTDNPDIFTIGCVSKSITGAGILLFSQDVKNDYLFQGKDLEITIGELLRNRQKYLKSLKELTLLQQEKLYYINDILLFASDEVLNSQVYKVLNHTSFFADDFNMYFLYSGVQSVINLFPNHIRNELILIGMQIYSSFFRESDLYKQISDDEHSKYSNIGFMYISFIMSLMTDKDSFYEEIREIMFKPLGIENKIIPVSAKNKFWFKQKFPNQNYTSTVGKEIRTVWIYQLIYTEMDTLNAGLLSDLKSANILMKEITKMYFARENKLTKDTNEISGLFFKYKAKYTNSGFYSLGTYIILNPTQITLKASGLIFNFRTELHYSLSLLDDNKENIFENYKYKKEDYNNEILEKAFLSKKNSLLDFVFFKHFSNETILKNIIAKSIVDLYYINGAFDNKSLLFDVNYERDKMVEKMRKAIYKNIEEFVGDNDKVYIFEKADNYLSLLKEFNYQGII